MGRSRALQARRKIFGIAPSAPFCCALLVIYTPPSLACTKLGIGPPAGLQPQQQQKVKESHNLDSEVLQSGFGVNVFFICLANFQNIDCKFLSVFLWRFFPANFSVLFLQGLKPFQPPPPNSSPKLPTFLSNFTLFYPKSFHAVCRCQGSEEQSPCVVLWTECAFIILAMFIDTPVSER